MMGQTGNPSGQQPSMSICLVVLYGISLAILGLGVYWFNELEDACVRNRFPNKSSWWNSALSSNRKWKQDAEGNLLPYKKKWYHFGVYPKYEEAKPFSSSILVFLTDGEHLFQFLKFRFIDLIVAFLSFLIYSVTKDVKVWSLLVGYGLGVLLARIIKEMFFKKLD